MRAAAVALLLLLALPAVAGASANQEAVLQDDPKIVFADSTEELDRTLAEIAALGVDRIRVGVFWHLLAPTPDSFPEEGWSRYDRIVKLAPRHGLAVMLSLHGPAPPWATSRPGGKENHWRPSPAGYRAFVAAVGRRYSGTWTDPDGGSSPLPRVEHWSLWNEPNFPNSLLPQRNRDGRGGRAESPRLYRELADAGWAGLQESGHGRDVILLGETSPLGPVRLRANGFISPLEFVRELYCLDRSWRAFRGRAARVRGCPATAAARRGFARAHPALFRADGWAHHAYSLNHAPTWRGYTRDSAPLGSIGRLTGTLDRARRKWRARSRWPIWITEYGYETSDPKFGVSPSRQARWLGRAEYLAYRNPRIVAFTQFLLADDAPRTQYPEDDQRRWTTWQSGLFDWEGRPKPALEAFKRSVHVTPTRARGAARVRVFGVYRPPASGLTAAVQVRRGDGDWRTLRTAAVRNRRGYVLLRVRLRRSAALRMVWTAGSGAAQPSSQSMQVRVRPR